MQIAWKIITSFSQIIVKQDDAFYNDFFTTNIAKTYCFSVLKFYLSFREN